MATRMNETDPALRTDTTVSRPVVWPWVVLAVVVALALWWAVANNARNNTYSGTTDTGNGPSTITAPGPGPGSTVDTTPTTPAPATH